MSEFDLSPLRPRLKELAPHGRTALLPALHAAQSQYGYIPEPVAAEIGRVLRVPLADVFGVIDFYSMLYDHPFGKTVIRVCNDPVCSLAGSESLLEAIRHNLQASAEGISADGEFSIEESTCLGLCEHAPAVLAGQQAISQADPLELSGILTGKGERPQAIIGGEERILTRNCENERMRSIAGYVANGGYTGLKKALSRSPREIIEEIKESGLVGRGGAAFPTGIKWESAASAFGQPKYVVCNADESEPGTFKDRVLMEGDPHQVIEGMVITAYAVNAPKGYIYVRGEYPDAYQVLDEAVAEAHQEGFLGDNILDSGFDFEIEMRRGAGAYICGEETALFESIEGKRGFPRIKPPFPTTHGLFGKPTVVNNVETLSNVPHIINTGAKEYRKLGTKDSPGTKLFCVSGDVTRPGLYEVPFGIPIGHLIYDLAGGISGDGELKAMLFGGAAGVFATSDHLDVPLSFEDLGAAGLPLGSGVIMVFDHTRDLRAVLKRLAHFFAHESCGKCYPCQLGTQRQYEILDRLDSGHPQKGDFSRLSDIGWTMADASLCGLGQTAASAVLSAMTLWPDMFHR